jgi:hypothetical protein
VVILGLRGSAEVVSSFFFWSRSLRFLAEVTIFRRLGQVLRCKVSWAFAGRNAKKKNAGKKERGLRCSVAGVVIRGVE